MYQVENIITDCTMGMWIDIRTAGKLHIIRYISLQPNSVLVEGAEALDNFVNGHITGS